MYQAFIDDSESHTSDDKRLVLAGYIQTNDAWAEFSRDWIAVLAADPILKSVHMSVGFPGHNNKERYSKIDALVAVLNKYKPLSIECIVSRADYEEFVRPVAPEYLRPTYLPCFMGMLFAVAGIAAEEGLPGPIELIFDNQGEVGQDAARLFDGLKYIHKELSVLASPPTFEDDEVAIPLQAADFLAWHLRKCVEKTAGWRVHAVADAITFRHCVVEVPREMIQAWAPAFAAVAGIEDAQTEESAQSIRTLMDSLTSTLPPGAIGPAMEKIAKWGERLHAQREMFIRLRLGWLWKLLPKGRLKF